MSDSTPRLRIPELVSMQEANCVTWNEALVQLDAFVDLYLLGQHVNTPPSSPADGDAYLVGGSPTGAWNGYAYKIASRLDGAWRFYTPFNGLRAFVATTSAFIVYVGGAWTDWNSLISANEVSLASAATCDLGAGSLFVQITGTTTIASFGTSANRLRFVRFAQALTLTHNATSLILLGGASRTTAAGDVGVYASDASGNWRERSYFRAAVNPGDFATKSGSETLTNKTISGATLSGTTTLPSGSINSFGLSIGGGTPTGNNPFLVVSATGEGLPTMSIGGPVIQNNNAGWGAALTIIGGASGYSSIVLGDHTQQSLGVVQHNNSSNGNTLQLSAGGVAGTLLNASGVFYPVNDNTQSLGSSGKRWSVVYAGTGTINTSGAETKANTAALSQAEIAVAKALAANIRIFQFCDAVANKGEAAARLHAGMIYEDVVAAFAAEGLDPLRYGIVCRDPATKKVTKTRTVQRPKMRSVAVSGKRIVVTDGVARLEPYSETRQEQAGTTYSATDGKTGEKYELFVPETEDVEETYEVEEPDLNETGAQRWLLGLRYGELAQFVIAGLAARLAALEAKDP
jgi:hypothetical protein